MTQQTFFVNCPFCGQIVEVVCPKPGRTPTQVESHKEKMGDWGSVVTTVGCSRCSNRMFIFWYF